MKVLTVSELTSAIKSVLEPPFRAISVKGEISNFKAQSSGHLYFSLKDASSQISAVLFKGNAAQLPRTPKEGDQVVALGEISLYAPRGQYQIVVRELQFLGVGELLLKFHQLKEELSRRGWFNPERKKPIPKLPKRIGVVTSPTGAVIQDIIHVLTRRFAGCQLILNPVKVQGEGAAQEIAQAIYDFNRHRLADVLIVGRGGGSIEDLWAFNEEIVAKAIFESAIPIISAVGHETDYTIADWAADVRAPTPSAAAEIAIAEKANLIRFLEGAERLVRERIGEQLRQRRDRIGALKKHPLLSSPYGLLAPPMQRLDDLSRQIEYRISELLQASKERVRALQKHPLLSSPYGVLAPTQQRLSDFARQLERLDLRAKVLDGRERLERLKRHLRSLHPQNILAKGYAILFSEKGGSVILSAKDVQPNQKFVAQLHDGQIAATINQVKENV
ncbi:MAG: exodeoxyribonuclease VII large subunit [Chlamydiales bacterium]